MEKLIKNVYWSWLMPSATVHLRPFLKNSIKKTYNSFFKGSETMTDDEKKERKEKEKVAMAKE